MTQKQSLERLTVPGILMAKANGRKITALTAYDYTMARIIDSAGVDIILVGDSVGTVIQGLSNTIPVTLEEMIYHSRCVVRGVENALVVGDMPFLSYQPSVESAILAAGRMLKEGGVSAVKIEGGTSVAEIVRRLVELDIPVMGHVGLTPQSIHRMGGYKVQGKAEQGIIAGSRERVIEDALAIAKAGVFSLVIEGVPQELAREITEQVNIPTIGIGAGSHCDGQVLVSYDMLGLVRDFSPKFVKRYAELAELSTQAIQCYIKDVRQGVFPGIEHSYLGK